MSQAVPAIDENVTIGSYGAEFLDSSEIFSDLYPIVVFGSISDRYTFATSSVDIISVGDTAAAQEGSSGGVIVDTDDQAEGLITTSSLGSGNVTTRTLHAITPDYIRRAFAADTGNDLDTYLSSGSPASLVQAFSVQAAGLSSLLEEHIR